jgi:hypothetical protein
MAAYPMPTPADATHDATSSCHGAAISANATRYPAPSTVAPTIRVRLAPVRPISALETGAKTIIISPAGAIQSPACRMVWPSP